jgi:putative chitinase
MPDAALAARAPALPDFVEALRHLWPHGNCKIAGLIEGMTTAAATVFDKHGMTTPLLVAHVMAQVSHECGAGTEVVENLNYSATRMMAVWPSRFPSHASAAPYAHNPRALANKVYNGRMGNRAESDDGWSFRGRGAVQTTGRNGYLRLAAATGLDLAAHPDLVNDPAHFLECGVADFVLCGCLPHAKRRVRRPRSASRVAHFVESSAARLTPPPDGLRQSFNIGDLSCCPRSSGRWISIPPPSFALPSCALVSSQRR